MSETTTSRRWKTEDLPPLVGAIEAAKILGVSYPTLTRWIHSGYVVPPRQMPAGPIWVREDLERFAVEVGRQRPPKRSR